MKRIVEKKKNEKKKKPIKLLKKNSRRNHWSEKHDKLIDRIINAERFEKEQGEEEYFVIVRNTQKTKQVSNNINNKKHTNKARSKTKISNSIRK